MNREELIEKWQVRSEIENTEKGSKLVYARAMIAEFLSDINQLAQSEYERGVAEATPKWISVEDSLPQPGERVLGFNGFGIQISWVNQRNKWNNVYGEMEFSTTHWMPLPNSPIKSQSEPEDKEKV
jgi:hypothetical protein